MIVNASRSRRFGALLGSTAIITLTVSPALAGNVDWVGTTTDWQVSSNWSSNAAPTATDTVTINTITPSPTILGNGTGSTGSLYVGTTGTGSLTLDSGVGLTSAASSSIGDQASGSGFVTVRGSTSWQITGGAALDIGKFGNGTLNISNGAQVAGTNVTLGTSGGSNGVANIDGANSELVVTDTLTVGNIGTGTINLTRGGQAIAGNAAVIGAHSHAPGLVSVDGTNSWFSANNVTVGSFGAGTVTVTNGGTLSAGSTLDLGYYSGEGGTVTVSGTGSMVKVGSGGTGSLAIGVGSTGTLNVTSGASGSVSGGVIVGNDSNISGTLNVTGNGTQFTVSAFNGNNGSVYAGLAGNGTINVGDAASLTAERFFIGNQAGSSGVLNVQSGAAVVANSSIVVAHGANSTGTVTVTGAGSSLTSANGMTIGDVGNGTLNVLAGANVSANGPTILGNAAGSTGTATIDGAGSQLSAGMTTIGGGGNGVATVSGAGSMSVTGLNVGIGGSTGTLTVTGTGSSFAASGLANIGSGNGSTGIMTVADGARANVMDTNIGYAGTGTLNVQGAGSQFNVDPSGTLIVGHFGSSVGYVAITGGSAVSDATAILGAQSHSQGSIKVDGAGSSWTTSGTAYIAGAGDGEALVTNGGTLSAGNIVIANTGGSLGVLHIGSWGTTPGDPGTIKASNITFGDGLGFLLFNHTSSAYTFDTPLIGAGHITQLAGHTILTGNDSAFSGVVEVDGGRLSVNSNLSGGTATVGIHGAIGGNGTLGSLAVIGGTVAPGNSIGTLNVAGNASFASGSFYEVQIDAKGNSDKLAVGGATAITGGTVEAQVAPGKYAPTTKYSILTSGGGVTGTFAGVTSDATFLTPSLSYDANDVYLTMTRNAASFASVGNTRNQIATGAGVDSLGYGNALWNAVVTLNAAQARNAFDQLSGDIHSSTAAAIVDDSRFLRAAAIDRLRDAFRSSGGGNPAMAYAAIGDAPAAPDASFAVWGRVVGAWGEASSDGNAAALARRTGGFFSGFDARVADEWRVGVLTGYTRSSLTSSSDASSAAIDTYHAGGYAGAQWGAFGLRTGAAYAWHHVDTSRTVAIPGFIDHLTAGYGANTAQVFGELGYNIALTQRAAIEPFAGLAFVDFRGNGFSEAGGAAALTAQARTTDVGFSTLGLRGAAGFDLAGMDASWKGSLGWRHVYGDVTPVTTFAFAGGDPFTVAGLPIARDAAAIDAGLDLGVARNVKVGIAYTGQIAKGFADHGAKAELNWKF